jgi:hypothetical protein
VAKPAISAKSLLEFLRVLNANEACMDVPTSVAMRLMLMVLIRTCMLIQTLGAEIDLGKGEWIIRWIRR